ncbi:MAG: hypothetical protein HQ559_07420 [Lentisphaerae bacterium]|nr:hypothetical protein [Lentisphaerota bacterium]
MLHRTMKTRRSLFMLLALVPLILSPTLASAAIDTNVIPFGYSFEGDPYADGMSLLNTNGWTGVDDDDNLIIWTTNKYLYPGAYPLDKEGTNILAITAPSTNHVLDTGDQFWGHNVYVDLLIQPTFWSEDEAPVATNNPQMAFYVNSNGQIVVWGAYQDAGETNHAEWIELAHNPFETGIWKRISIAMSYNPHIAPPAPSPSGRNYFRLTLDNKQYLTNYLGQTKPNEWDHDGPWFMSSDYTNPVFAMHQLEFSGVSFIDDYVVTTNEPPLGITADIKSIKGTGIEANPAGNIVPVITNTSKTFVFGETEGYNLTNIAWGVSFSDATRTNYLGPGTNSFTFTNVIEDMSIEAFSEAEKRTLVVVEPDYGVPDPQGTNIYDYNTLIPVSIAGSPIDMGSGTQRAVIAWTRWTDGGVTNTGTGTNFSFEITGVATDDWTHAEWTWSIQYMLTSSNDGPGQITGASDGWKNEGTSWTLTAEPIPWSGWGWKFDSWSGDTNGCVVSNNVCDNTVMSQARDIVAHYVQETHSPMGVDLNYYIDHGVSGEQYASSYATDMADWDFDGLLNWEEYVAGTCMTNEFSIFEVLYTEAYDGSNSVAFYGTTNSGLGHIPYGMYRATNLMDDATSLWTLVSQDIERASDGTNVWWDMAPPAGMAIYLPVATNDPAVP